MTSSVPSGHPPDGTDASHNLFLGGYYARLIENSLHWVLDVVFREDDSRHHAGNSCENLALLRKLAISLLKQEEASDASLKTKRLCCCWDHDYLAKVLAADNVEDA
ncbi:MAG: transposase [Planctomycetaceae bacterium]|nr:transposase [Planctomycetaceae bacterium]